MRRLIGAIGNPGGTGRTTLPRMLARQVLGRLGLHGITAGAAYA